MSAAKWHPFCLGLNVLIMKQLLYHVGQRCATHCCGKDGGHTSDHAHLEHNDKELNDRHGGHQLHTLVCIKREVVDCKTHHWNARQVDGHNVHREYAVEFLHQPAELLVAAAQLLYHNSCVGLCVVTQHLLQQGRDPQKVEPQREADWI